MIGADKVLIPHGAYQVALTADTSTTTALDLQTVADYLDGDGTDYRGYYRLFSTQAFYIRAGDKDVATIDAAVDNDNDEGVPVPANDYAAFVSTGPQRRFLKFRGGAAGATLFIMRG